MHDGFTRVAAVSDVPAGKGRKVIVGEEEVALWHVQDRFYAISNVCAHQHVSALHVGILEGLAISCPMHGWTYSLETGRTESGEGKVRVFKVIVEEGEIYVENPDPSW